jgi:hypothetical protein
VGRRPPRCPRGRRRRGRPIARPRRRACSTAATDLPRVAGLGLPKFTR